FRVHHFRGIDSLREKANPPIDLAQPPLAVLIVGVFTAIAVARSPRHHLGYRRSFPGEQKPVLVFEALKAARRDVVLDSRGGLVSLRFSRIPFSHTVNPSSANRPGPRGFQERDSATPVHTLSRRFCSEIGATPQKSLPTTRKFAVNDLRILAAGSSHAV